VALRASVDVVKINIPYILVIELRFLGRPASSTIVIYVGFEIFKAVTMKNAVFWDVALYESCKTNVSE
jgi:hypothetical protein